MVADRDAIRKEIVTVIAEQLNKPVTSISNDDSLEKLGADSLDRVEIIMKLEEQFGIEISDEEAEKVHTIGQVVDYVYKLKHGS